VIFSSFLLQICGTDTKLSYQCDQCEIVRNENGMKKIGMSASAKESVILFANIKRYFRIKFKYIQFVV